MNNQSSRGRGFLVIFGIILIIMIGANIFINYKNSFQEISVSVTGNPKNSKVNIYKLNDNDRTLVESFTNSQTTKRVKKGTYEVIFNGSGFQEQSTTIKVGDNPEATTINPSYTKERLAELLSNERAAINLAINEAIPQTKSSYVIDPGELYILGEWYGTTIHVRQTPTEERENYIDRYKVVLKKEGASWKVITIPPEIIISKNKYPKIPREVLIEVNKNPDADN